MKKIVAKHPLAIRWCHWINFPLLFIMIWSGLLIYWANDIYAIKFGETEYFKFFPKTFYQKFNIEGRLAEGMSWHFFIMWLFSFNGLIYILYLFFSKEWKFIIPNKNSFKEAFQVVLYDLKISKKHPPTRKFNGAQQFAYTGVILMGFLSLVTGIAIYKPIQFSSLLELLGGYEYARFEHFVLTLGYLAFFVIHLLQVLKAGWNNLRAMITGFELIAEEEAKLYE